MSQRGEDRKSASIYSPQGGDVLKITTVVAVAAVAFSILWSRVSIAAPPQATPPVTGLVYDVDFQSAQGWTQIAVRGVTGMAPVTKSAILQRVFESALDSHQQVTYHVDANTPPVIQYVLLRTTQACKENGCVESVSCRLPGECSATIRGESKEVRTSEPQAMGVLLTALVDARPVQELTVSKDGTVLRVKVNIP